MMMINRRHGLHVLCTALACATLPILGYAQPEWPTKPIRFIVPVAPGGSADMLARTLGERLGNAIGQTFVVDNVRGGGNTTDSNNNQFLD